MDSFTIFDGNSNTSILPQPPKRKDL